MDKLTIHFEFGKKTCVSIKSRPKRSLLFVTEKAVQAFKKIKGLRYNTVVSVSKVKNKKGDVLNMENEVGKEANDDETVIVRYEIEHDTSSSDESDVIVKNPQDTQKNNKRRPLKVDAELVKNKDYWQVIDSVDFTTSRFDKKVEKGFESPLDGWVDYLKYLKTMVTFGQLPPQRLVNVRAKFVLKFTLLGEYKHNINLVAQTIESFDDQGMNKEKKMEMLYNIKRNMGENVPTKIYMMLADEYKKLNRNAAAFDLLQEGLSKKLENGEKSEAESKPALPSKKLIPEKPKHKPWKLTESESLKRSSEPASHSESKKPINEGTKQVSEPNGELSDSSKTKKRKRIDLNEEEKILAFGDKYCKTHGSKLSSWTKYLDENPDSSYATAFSVSNKYRCLIEKRRKMFDESSVSVVVNDQIDPKMTQDQDDADIDIIGNNNPNLEISSLESEM